MARNSEKAVTALARWRQLQLQQSGKLRVQTRPSDVKVVFDPRRAERWRIQVIKEIAKKVTQIQNAGLGEFKIRDLNDEINRLLREKYAWEDRILELGGPDYKKVGPKMLDKEGKEVPGNRGYKYFGAAKELPGVKELLEQEAISAPKKSRAELMKEIDAEYYGYLDDEDYLLVIQEEKCEKEARRKKIEEFYAAVADTDKPQSEEAMIEVEAESNELDSDGEEKKVYADYFDRSSMCKYKKRHLEVPSLKQVEEAILEHKKRELLLKYIGSE